VLAHREDRYRPHREGPLSKRVSAILTESSGLTQQMRLDAESLYVFANLALDQWSFVIAYGLGLRDPTNYRYRYLVDQLQGRRTPAALSSIKERHLADAVWLLYQVRSYRNAFVEHVERPWQRGSTMGLYTDDFRFFITTPIGWIAPEEEKRLIDAIRPFAPEWTKRLPADHWQASPRGILTATYEEVDKIKRVADREKVWEAWQQLGGSTLSFDRLAGRLVGFLNASTETVQERVELNPRRIDLGPPPHRGNQAASSA